MGLSAGRRRSPCKADWGHSIRNSVTGAPGRVQGPWILGSGTLKLRARFMDDILSFKSETPHVHGVLEPELTAVRSGGSNQYSVALTRSRVLYTF